MTNDDQMTNEELLMFAVKDIYRELADINLMRLSGNPIYEQLVKRTKSVEAPIEEV